MNAVSNACKRCARKFVQRARRQGRRARYCSIPCRTKAATLLRWQRRNGLAPVPVSRPRQPKPGDAVWNDRLGCEVVYPDGTPYAREAMGYADVGPSDELVRFLGDFPSFDPETGEPVDNPGWHVVDLRRGWRESPEDRAQDEALERLEVEHLAEALASLPDAVRETIGSWFSDD